MANQAQLTGMQGVFLVAAELSARGLVVATTSRNAMGADLLVTDATRQRTWSVQVKTNRKPAPFWLLGKSAKNIVSPSHIYVLVNLRPRDGMHEYYVLRSRELAQKMRVRRRRRSTWHSIARNDVAQTKDRWQIFSTKAR